MSQEPEFEIPYRVIKVERSPTNRTGVIVVIELEYKDDINELKRKLERGEIKIRLV